MNTVTIIFTPVQCCVCSCWFGMDSSQNSKLHEVGGSFYCPNGHSQYYIEPEVEKLRRHLKYAETEAANARYNYQFEKRSHAATKGKLTQTKKRIANGVCPCCHRSFANLNRHMTGQHPGYTEEVSI